jgi:hypothetical protein
MAKRKTVYVIVNKETGEPFQLPAEPGSETSNRVGEHRTFTIASTSRMAVKAMLNALPGLLDTDGDMGLEIREFTCGA